MPPALVNTPMYASTNPLVGATFFENWLNHYLIENKVSQAGSQPQPDPMGLRRFVPAVQIRTAQDGELV
ncbi:MAG: hypothetical protein JO271_14315 [Verrucomicrobia bacterium]|nr:hypothetical protein [Verrucomicrobiota bacterium]MBV9272865.1 hypothetical protein [Verrucomicrobiota bacterium]